MSNKLKHITDANFEEEVLKSDLPIVVDFWAPWCAPCKSLAPVLEELAEEFAGKVYIGKVNIDENSVTPTKYNVRSIPNLVFFKSGQVVDQSIGNVPKEQLSTAIKKLL